MIQCFVSINMWEIVEERGRKDKGQIVQLLDVFTKLFCSQFYSLDQENLCFTGGWGINISVSDFKEK